MIVKHVIWWPAYFENIFERKPKKVYVHENIQDVFFRNKKKFFGLGNTFNASKYLTNVPWTHSVRWVTYEI